MRTKTQSNPHTINVARFHYQLNIVPSRSSGGRTQSDIPPLKPSPRRQGPIARIKLIAHVRSLANFSTKSASHPSGSGLHTHRTTSHDAQDNIHDNNAAPGRSVASNGSRYPARPSRDDRLEPRAYRKTSNQSSSRSYSRRVSLYLVPDYGYD